MWTCGRDLRRVREERAGDVLVLKDVLALRACLFLHSAGKIEVFAAGALCASLADPFTVLAQCSGKQQ